MQSSTTPRSQQFSFILSAGAAVSYVDFNEFRLYDPISKVVIGTASLPGNGFKPSTTTRGTPAGSTAASSPTASATNAAAKVAIGGLGVFGAAMMLL